MSFAKADFRRFSKFGPKSDRIHPEMVPRIKTAMETSREGCWNMGSDE
jgi:hypothetical protein